VRAAQAMSEVRIGQIGGPAIVDNFPAIARDDIDVLNGCLAPFSVQALQRDVPG